MRALSASSRPGATSSRIACGSPIASPSRSRPISRRFSTGFATRRPPSSPPSSSDGRHCSMPRNAPDATRSSTSSTPTTSATRRSSSAASTPFKSERPLTSDAAVIEPARLARRGALAPTPRRVGRHRAPRRRDRPLSASSSPTSSSSRTCPALAAVFCRRACSPPSANSASASPTPPPSRSTSASRPSPSAAATSTGSTGAGRARPSSARPSSNGLPAPSRTPSGLAPSTRATGPRRLPQRHHPRPRLQVDPHPLSLLGRPHPLQRIPLPRTRSRNVSRRSSSSPPPSLLHNSLAVRLRARVSRRHGTTGVDPLHVSGHILYTLGDAMEADECADGAGEVRARAGVGRVDDERAVRAPRRVAADRVQVGPTVQGRRRRRAEGAQPSPAWLPPSNSDGGRRADRALEEDSRLGRTKASPADSKAGVGRRTSVPQHGLRHPEAPRVGQEPASTPEVAAPGRGAAAHRCSERGVDDRFQGPVQDSRRHLLLSADPAGQLQPVLARVPGAVRCEDGGSEGHSRAGVPRAWLADGDPQRQRIAVRVDRDPWTLWVERVVDEARDRPSEDPAQQSAGERRARANAPRP